MLSARPNVPPNARSGATYKLVVRSAEEAVKTIREQLGENARVLSVRQLPGQGLGGLFGRPRLEVIAQLEAPSPAPEPLPGPARGLDAIEPPPPQAEAGPLRDAQAGLPDLLRRSGFSPMLIGRLQGTPALAGFQGKPLHHSLVDVGSALRAAACRRTARPLPPRVAFLGTPGVGRTTALCKWLARDVFSRGRTGRVFKAEIDRPNPAAGLDVFCEALGIVLEHVTPETPAEERPADFVYMDLPSLSVRRPGENRPIGRFLEAEKIDGRVLVLNAAYDSPVMREAYAAGRDLGATHLVFTHLDELSHWGKLWDLLVDGDLTPLFLSTGPGLAGDLETDAVNAVLRRTLPGAMSPHLS